MSEVHERFALAFAQVDVVRKAQKNDFHGYHYRGIDDLRNALHAILADNGLFYVPRLVASRYADVTTSKGKSQQQATLDYEFEFYAPDGTSLVVGPVVGQAADSDDKAPMQAASQAEKVALISAFCIPTDDQDPDATSPLSENGGRAAPDPEHQALLDELDALLDTAEAEGLEPDRPKAVEHASHSADHARFVIGKLTERIQGDEPGAGQEGRTPEDPAPTDGFDADATWMTVDRLRKRLEIPRPRMLTHARLIVDEDELDDTEGRVRWEKADDVGADAHPQVLRGLRSWLEDLDAQKGAS